MPKLVATKPFRLSGGRVYQPGETFEVRTEAQARLLVAIGKASLDAEEAARDASRDVLRQQAEAYGIDVDGRWGAARLQDEIAHAQRMRQQAAAGTYSRRDMVAEDPNMPKPPAAEPAEPEPEPTADKPE